MIGRPLQRLAIALVLTGSQSGSIPAGEPDWPVPLSSKSSPSLAEKLERLVAPHPAALRGVAVRDVHWKEDRFELHLKEGVVFLEPAVDGRPRGAYFTGTAEVRFAPVSRTARRQLEVWLGSEALAAEPITAAYWFTIGTTTVLDQLGVSAEPTLSLDDPRPYVEIKAAFRHRGLAVLHEHMNGDGPAAGTSHVLMAAPGIRVGASDGACLMYSKNPGDPFEIRLSVFGHHSISQDKLVRNRFWSIAEEHADGWTFEPQGRVAKYNTRLTFESPPKPTAVATTVRLAPRPGIAALRFSLATRLQVKAVTDGSGRHLSFLQWSDLVRQSHPDRSLLVDLGRPAAGDAGVEVVVEAEGELFRSVGVEATFYTPGGLTTAAWLGEEDEWYPALDDPDGSIHELFLDLPKRFRGAAPGNIVAESTEGNRRGYHFRTSRPQRRSSLYVGDFRSSSTTADTTAIEVLYDRDDLAVGKSLDFVTTEIANAVRVFNRILVPLDTPNLRVVSVPTYHGRGFDGLLLLSRLGFRTDSSGADTFRAHEVAHAWWGNWIEPRDWPTDRWLSESLAEYMALEYYLVRYENSEKYREWIGATKVRPVVDEPSVRHRNLRGETSRLPPVALLPLTSGGDQVYTKGPLVLHMLRYLFRVQKGSDAHFWEMLRDLLRTRPYERVSTAEFESLAEKHLGQNLGWFWDQWVYGTDIPRIRWTHDVQQVDSGWRVRVRAEQLGTAFQLHLPVHVFLSGKREATKPLVMRQSGELEMVLPEKPTRVSLNEYYEALVVLEH